MSKILITGLSGLLGNSLAFVYRDRYEVAGIYNSHRVDIDGVKVVCADLSDGPVLSKIPAGQKPDIIIHCAALPNVDQCEEDKKLAYKLNIGVTKNITEYSKRINAYLVYISTDCVYDGVKGNFKEEDVNPINYYGETKLAGERAALEYENTFVARTNFFGMNIQRKLNLAEWILYSLKNNDRINGFSDVFFSAMYTGLLSNILEKVFTKGLKGVYNIASADSMSKYDFAVSLADRFNLDKGLIKKMSVDEFGFKAKRGKNMSLDTGKISKGLGMAMPSMSDSIARFCRDYKANRADNIRRCSSHA